MRDFFSASEMDGLFRFATEESRTKRQVKAVKLIFTLLSVISGT